MDGAGLKSRKLLLTLVVAGLILLAGYTMSPTALPVVVDGLVWLALGYGGANIGGKVATALATRKTSASPALPAGK